MNMANRSSELNISDKSIVKVVLWAIFFYGLYYFRELLLILFLSIIIASVVDRVVNTLKKYKVSRVATVSFIYLFFFVIFLFGFYFLVPLVSNYINIFIQKLPEIINSIKASGQSSPYLESFANYFSQISKDFSSGKIFEIIKTAVFGGTEGVLSGAGKIISGGINFILVIVISFYLSLEERSVQRFLRLISSKSYEDYVVDLWDRSQAKISAWFIGQVSIAFFISIIVYIILLILNIPFALMIAVVAFLGELIPVVGLTISGLVATVVAYTSGGISLMITTLLAFLILSQFESHFLYPKVMGRAVGMPTVIVILALIIGGSAAGFWGVVIAIPVSSFFVELIQDFDKKKKREWEDIY